MYIYIYALPYTCFSKLCITSYTFKYTLCALREQLHNYTYIYCMCTRVCVLPFKKGHRCQKSTVVLL